MEDSYSTPSGLVEPSAALRAQEELLPHRSALPKSFSLYTRVKGDNAPCISVGVTVSSSEEAMAVAEVMTKIIAPMYATMAKLDQPRGLSAGEAPGAAAVDNPHPDQSAGKEGA